MKIIWKLKVGNQLGQEDYQTKLGKGIEYIEKLKEDNDVEVTNKGTHLEIITYAKGSKPTTESV